MNRRKARVLALKILFQEEYRDIPDLRSLAALLDRNDTKDRGDQKNGRDLSLRRRGESRGRAAVRNGGAPPREARLRAEKAPAGAADGRRGRPDEGVFQAVGKSAPPPKLSGKEEKSRQAGLERIAFALKIVQGVGKHREAIDQAIALAGESWTPDRMALIDLNIMRIAVFEMLFQPDIPGKTSVNEAVESAKIFGGRDSASFVNGVLDKILRSPPSNSGLSSSKK